MREVTIGRDDAGQRLDRFLRKYLPAAPLGRLFKLQRTGRVRVNGEKGRPERRLVAGDVVAIDLADGQLAEFSGRGAKRAAKPSAAAAASLRILHRDDHVLAVDKPAFLLVQKGEGRGEPTLEELVQARLGASGALTFQPALAHRLDRGTSGVVLCGVSAEGLRGLVEAFRRRKVRKRYLALVAGAPAEDEFRIDLPLARDPSDDLRGAKVKVSRAPGAQPAETDVSVLARSPDGAFALVEARPRTGRTHQIRVHLRAVGLPIVGDPTYGDPRRNSEWRSRPGIRRQFLHASRVELRHPVDADRELVVESPLPEDLRRTLEWARIELPRSGP